MARKEQASSAIRAVGFSQHGNGFFYGLSSFMLRKSLSITLGENRKPPTRPIRRSGPRPPPPPSANFYFYSGKTRQVRKSAVRYRRGSLKGPPARRLTAREPPAPSAERPRDRPEAGAAPGARGPRTAAGGARVHGRTPVSGMTVAAVPGALHAARQRMRRAGPAVSPAALNGPLATRVARC